MANVKLQEVIDRGKNPTHCSKQNVNDQIQQILTLMNDAQKQVAEWRQTIVNSQYDRNADPGDDVLYERLNTTLRAIERDMTLTLDSTRRMRKGFMQYERYCEDLDKHIAARSANRSDNGS